MTSVSIIIPIYNVASYIDRCLESIFLQECDDVRIECILVNDCTPDESMKLVARKLSNYSGNISFTIINHSINQGLSIARNTGLKAANNEFVLFVDSDDRLQPNAIHYLIGDLTDNLIDVIMGNTYICNRGAMTMSFKDDEPMLIDNEHEKGLRMLLSRDLFHTAWNKLIRRELLINNLIMFEDGIIEEDFLWSFLIFYHAKRILVKPQITYYYENNPMSLTNTSNQNISWIINSRVIICSQIMNRPTRYSQLECNMYIFYILIRAYNLFEQNRSHVSCLSEELYKTRNLFLRRVIRDGFFVQFVFFLTSVKPFYYINLCKWYRRYYNNIADSVLAISRLFIKRHYVHS